MIKVSHLNKTYDRGRRNANRVLKDVSFQLPDTGFVCILGASGCGKTSLLNAIGGLDAFDNGALATGNVEVNRYGTTKFEAERNANFGYIFQNYYLLMDHSVGYNVYLGLHNLNLSHGEKMRRVKTALREVEMERYIRRTVGELSGGQQQRVAIARALARQPRVIFADEPTGNLDEDNTLKICTLLRRISQRSLVVMVTHEQRLANFFADRVITMDDGVVVADTTEWDRQSLQAEKGKTVYTGDYTETQIASEGLRLRLLSEPGAEPAELTLILEKGRIVLKLDDSRTAVFGDSTTVPVLKEGKRPVLSLEILDRQSEPAVSAEPPVESKKKSPGLVWREARRLSSLRGGIQGLGMKVFLALLTVVTMIIVGDYLEVASLDPEDFITSDPHILELTLDYGPKLTENNTRLADLQEAYLAWLRENVENIHPISHVSTSAIYTESLFLQSGEQKITFTNFSYVPLQYFDETTLILGRMPTCTEEIVVDRWVLEKALEGKGILPNSVPDYTYFLNKTLNFHMKDYAPVIVGICDAGSPAMYLPEAGLLSVSVGMKAVIGLSEFKALYPGQHDDLILGEGECAVNASTAGIHYINRIGSPYRLTNRVDYTIIRAFKSEVYASAIVSDDALEKIRWEITSNKIYLYCQDITATKALLRQGSPMEADGHLSVAIADRYATTMAAYRKAATLQADARTIVTFTIIVLAMVMLYLLCRARTQQRLGMLAVYRLLGIPNRKLAGIFTLESLLASLSTAAPAACLTWLVVEAAKLVPQWSVSMRLPWQAAVLTYLAIALYHVLVTLLPLLRLLRIPPAQLAAKYDL